MTVKLSDQLSLEYELIGVLLKLRVFSSLGDVYRAELVLGHSDKPEQIKFEMRK